MSVSQRFETVKAVYQRPTAGQTIGEVIKDYIEFYETQIGHGAPVEDIVIQVRNEIRTERRQQDFDTIGTKENPA